MTYTILAVDSASGEIGAATQSHYFAIGRRALSVLPGVGAVASQSFGSPAHGPNGLDALAAGALSEDVLAGLVAADENRDVRQILVIDAAGRAAAHTGASCVPLAGQSTGDRVVAAGNMLAGACWDAMVAAFESSASQPMEYRLLAALDAAQEAGGDARGMMSAAMKVVGPRRTVWPSDGTLVDLRVDEHERPLEELRRLVGVARAYRVLSRVVYAPGFLVGTPAPESDPVPLDEVAVLLDEAQQAMPEEAEIAYWRSVVAERRGMHADAIRLRADAFALRPTLTRFADALEGVGLVHPAATSATGT